MFRNNTGHVLWKQDEKIIIKRLYIQYIKKSTNSDFFCNFDFISHNFDFLNILKNQEKLQYVNITIIFVFYSEQNRIVRCKLRILR